MRKALFRKDLMKDLGKGGNDSQEIKNLSAEEIHEKEESDKPTIHLHKYPYTRRLRSFGLLQIITGVFLYFVSIFLPVFGGRNWLTDYIIPMGSVSGPITVLSGIFATETRRNRKKWAIIVYMVMCCISFITNFVQLIGSLSAYGKEQYGWDHNMIYEPVMLKFRYISYTTLIFLCLACMFYAGFSLLLDGRAVSPTCRRICNFRWIPERENYPDTTAVPVVAV